MSAQISSEARNKNAGPRASLAARRARARRIFSIVISVLALIVAGVLVWAFWQPMFRIQQVEAAGEKSAELQTIASTTLSGTYGFVLPRDSFFFLSESAIRNSILNTYPDLSAVSVSRTGLTRLDVSVIERVAAFRWCGSGLASSTTCYLADAEGLVFKEASAESASTTETLLALYAPLSETATSSSPLRAHISGIEHIPSTLRFIGALADLHAPIDRVELRGDEADLYVKGTNTRITYVLGKEEDAATLAGVTLPKLSVTDGSVSYIDLRFPGKAYFKKK